MIINLISGPRNISTALMYSFAQHSKVKVVDEPFYAYYLKHTGLDHPGKAEVIESLPSDPHQVILDLKELQEHYEVVFIKNMAHHHMGLDWSYLVPFKNIFLIRNPKQLIASFAQVIHTPTMQDIGLEIEADLLDYAIEYGDHEAYVLDSNDILDHPSAGLKSLCNKLGLPFESAMLEWEKGPIPEDGSWAKYWYSNVHNSTGFTKQKTSERALPKRCEALLEEALPYYEKLKEYSDATEIQPKK